MFNPGDVVRFRSPEELDDRSVVDKEIQQRLFNKYGNCPFIVGKEYRDDEYDKLPITRIIGDMNNSDDTFCFSDRFVLVKNQRFPLDGLKELINV